jgi:glycosyltransferase involved in cell wall biosynthesis
MRVLLVNDRALGPGSGVEVHVARVARALEDAGDTVDVFAGEVTHEGIGKALDVWDPAARRKLAERARRFQPDVVHHHNVVRELSVSVLGVPARAAQVLTVHDYRLVQAHEGSEGSQGSSISYPMLWAKSVKGVLDRAVVRRRVDVVVAVSRALGSRLDAARLPRVTTVENFADPEPCWTPPEGHDLLFAGRLSEEKGLDVLIDAFATAVGAGAPGRLRLAGAGPAEESLRALAARVAPARVVFEGLVSEHRVRELMRSCRAVCAVSTRLTEGAPLVAIEALLVGRPVVATDSPAFRDLLERREGRVGLIVGPGDRAALAGALERVLTDDEYVRATGRRAYDLAARVHTPQRAVTDLHKVYERAMELHR